MPVADALVFNVPDKYKDVDYNIILHNDDTFNAANVVDALMVVLKYSHQKATELMYKAHREGRAIVFTCKKEIALHYQQQLEREGLTITVEPVL